MTLSSHENAFQALMEKHYSQASGHTLLQKIKAQGWSHFLKLGLPTKQNEAYRNIKLRKLFAHPYALSIPKGISLDCIAPHIYPECTNSVLVFVNGHFQPALSNTRAIPHPVSISLLSEAIQPYGALLNNHYSRTMKEESDPFVALNAALHHDGVFIYLPPKSIVDAPIQILHVIDACDAPLFILPRLHLFVGPQSQAVFLSSTASLSGANYCLNQATTLILEENAHVNYLQMTGEAPSDAWHFDALRAYLKRNSSLKTVSFSNGSSTMRHDYQISLAGENAEASLNGIWMLSENREAHTHVMVDHQAPHCRSTQLYKGVLNDCSRSSFEGKILVRPAAQRTDAFQLNHNLLLNDHAHADSKPNLEIFADDVKASHGATVGQLNEDQLFYMLSRGLTHTTAQGMLIHSYCKEVLDLIPMPSLSKEIASRIQRYL